jgi:squalene-hopene/tetraprenyl-beta-curcumene cyclase
MEVEEMKLPDGKSVDWREALTKKLFNLQKPDGSWQNENGRWWEGDPILATSYALLILERIYPQL